MLHISTGKRVDLETFNGEGKRKDENPEYGK